MVPRARIEFARGQRPLLAPIPPAMPPGLCPSNRCPEVCAWLRLCGFCVDSLGDIMTSDFSGKGLTKPPTTLSSIGAGAGLTPPRRGLLGEARDPTELIH